ELPSPRLWRLPRPPPARGQPSEPRWGLRPLCADGRSRVRPPVAQVWRLRPVRAVPDVLAPDARRLTCDGGRVLSADPARADARRDRRRRAPRAPL
ncbi:MAG: hypothetical protein AVDCRST_MAG85-619, partial [uncultured Solirubrobacteraceae bacterium]